MGTAADAPDHARRMGIVRAMVVRELGWDADTDDEIRAHIEDIIGGVMVGDDTDEVVDVVLLWWRNGDGDLACELTDVVRLLSDTGAIWVLTPVTGKPGHVDRSEVAEEAHAAGLVSVAAVTLGAWSGNHLARPPEPPSA
ncbi:hypothetical protein B4N89_43130 [Embleya scabrispora]|uniref:DUF3052 domain-containing protein n=1 Tax=Embleya scabrispora TaxID=159449 RepID=A0A1T3NKT3_9ACTN|nr:DUF3052 family protein [Embleya scabrispora]OPC77318.1 hypothetical protein B4N89_43130 [Embleya scabrispora]